MSDFIDRMRHKGLIPPLKPTPPKPPTEEAVMPIRMTKEEADKINIEVPERVVIQSAIVDGRNSKFAQLIDAAEVFRKANLTPLYFTNKTQTAIRVIPKEYLDDPLMIN